MRRLLLIAIFLTGLQGFGQGNWMVDSSYIGFHIVNAGIRVKGTFDELNTKISFNPKQLRKSRVIASVNSGSVDTGIRIRDNHLRKSDFFDTEQYSLITMTSTDILKRDSFGYQANFILDLKGKKEFLTIPFSFQVTKDYAIMEGNFAINRLDYHIGEKSLVLSDSVNIYIWLRLKEE